MYGKKFTCCLELLLLEHSIQLAYALVVLDEPEIGHLSVVYQVENSSLLRHIYNIE